MLVLLFQEFVQEGPEDEMTRTANFILVEVAKRLNQLQALTVCHSLGQTTAVA